MNLLPKASGARPRVACDIAAYGVVAARSDTPGSPMAQIARAELSEGAVVPSLKPGNIADRVAVIAAVKKAFEAIGMKANSRDANVSLIIPDASVRVLLLEFDSLPTKLSDALPLVRFRLKKMLPFDADDAMITYQVLSTSKTLVRVLAVAVPRDVLGEYESVVREAGYEPGAVVPSTLATIAAIDADPALVVNANEQGVTAAIVRGGVLLLHRSVDFHVAGPGPSVEVPEVVIEQDVVLPLVDVDETAEEWAAQEALPEHGRNPYADREVEREPGDLAYSPYAQSTVMADLSAELHNAILIAPTSLESLADDNVAAKIAAAALHVESPTTAVHIELDEEIAQALSVFVAYYEDTLGAVPGEILAAGPLGAAEMNRLMRDRDVAEGIHAQEVVTAEALGAEGTRIPRGWLAGVMGALHG